MSGRKWPFCFARRYLSEEQFLARRGSAEVQSCEFPTEGPRLPPDREGPSKLQVFSERSRTTVNEHCLALLLFRFLAKDESEKSPYGSADIKRDECGKIVGPEACSLWFPDGSFEQH